MPQVPVYNENQVRPSALPNIRVQSKASQETFGGGQIANQQQAASEQLATATSKFAQEETARANETLLSEKRRALNQWELDNVYGPNGYKNKVGKNAFSVPDDLNNDLKKFTEENSKDLSSDQQKLAFSQLVDSRRDSLMKWANEHVSANRAAVEDAEFQAGLESSKERASVNVENVPLETAMVKNSIIKRAERLGWDKEQTAQELQKHESDLHGRVINNFLNNNQILQAKDYFDKVSLNIDPDLKSKIQSNMKEGMARVESANMANNIISKSTGLMDAYEKAKEIQDPLVKDATVSRIRDHYSMLKVAENEREEKLSKQVYDIIEKNPSRDAIPPQLWAALPLSARNAADSRIKQLREGIPPTTDWQLYYDQKTLATTAKDQFLTKNLFQYRPKLADAEYKELVNLQIQLRKGDAEGDKILNGYRAHSAIVDQTLASAGIKPNADYGTRDYEAAMKFRRAVDEQVLAHQETTGKKATSAEVQSIADQLLVQGVTEKGKGWLWNTKKRLFQVEQGEGSLEVIDAKEIPRNDRIQIESAMQARGIKVSDDAILKIYNERIKRAFK